ncbi:hypothetical protein ACJX0J_020478, partial [Zea mays]
FRNMRIFSIYQQQQMHLRVSPHEYLPLLFQIVVMNTKFNNLWNKNHKSAEETFSTR